MDLIFIIGFMASGKTTFGKKLADEMQYGFMDLDKEIEQQTGLSIAEIFKQKGESFFREKEHKILKEIIVGANRPTIISCGGGTPFFYDNMERMKQHGKVVFLHTDFDIILERLENEIEKNERPLLYGTEDKVEKSKMIKRLYEARMEKYKMADLIINEQNQPIAAIIRLLIINVDNYDFGRNLYILLVF